MFDEKQCLSCNPFEGDFGAPGDKVLEDKIVTARKARPCVLCGQNVTPGTRVRVRAEVYSGQFYRFVWCTDCCVAMAKSWDDNGNAYEVRAAIGRQNGAVTA